MDIFTEWFNSVHRTLVASQLVGWSVYMGREGSDIFSLPSGLRTGHRTLLASHMLSGLTVYTGHRQPVSWVVGQCTQFMNG